jgi:hypothetical protein
MLNLLLYDDGHPMALAFHRRSIDRDLDDLARTLGGERERGVPTCRCCRRIGELLDAAAGRATARGRAGRRAARARGAPATFPIAVAPLLSRSSNPTRSALAT